MPNHQPHNPFHCACPVTLILQTCSHTVPLLLVRKGFSFLVLIRLDKSTCDTIRRLLWLQTQLCAQSRQSSSPCFATVARRNKMALSENDPAAVGPLPSGAAQPASPPDSVPSVAHRPSSSATGADFASFYGPLLSGAAQPAEEAHIADILLTPHLPAAPVAALPDFSGEMLRHIPCAILNYLGCFSLDWYAFVAACKMAHRWSNSRFDP